MDTQESGRTPVVTIDCEYVQPGAAAAYLVAGGGQAAFVDNNTAHAVPILLDALKDHGIAPEQVAYAVVTHIHLDHAGGTAALLEACPNAVLLVHPHGTRHMVSPGRLVESVKAVYGEARFNQLYGSVKPIPEARVRAVADGEHVTLGNRVLTMMHTPGHARHHICVHDSGSNGVFTGDTFGVRYPAIRGSGKPVVVCSTAPTDFDPAAAKASIARIVETGAERVYVSHFGELDGLSEAARVVGRSIDAMANILDEAAASELAGQPLADWCVDKVHAAVVEHLQYCGVPDLDNALEWFGSDIRMNGQGIAVAAERKRRGRLST